MKFTFGKENKELELDFFLYVVKTKQKLILIRLEMKNSCYSLIFSVTLLFLFKFYRERQIEAYFYTSREDKHMRLSDFSILLLSFCFHLYEIPNRSLFLHVQKRQKLTYLNFSILRLSFVSSCSISQVEAYFIRLEERKKVNII